VETRVVTGYTWAVDYLALVAFAAALLTALFV
jgi:hypothetical protein